MICKTFLLALLVCVLGMVISFVILAQGQKRNRLSLIIIGVVCVLLTCAGALGIGLVQKRETARVSSYAHVWQKQLYSDVEQCNSRRECDRVVREDLSSYEKGYQALHIDNDRVAPKHRRPSPKVSVESGVWKKGEQVRVILTYNEDSRPYAKVLTIQ